MTTTAILSGTCTDQSCLTAVSHTRECECSCGGIGHGREAHAGRVLRAAAATARAELAAVRALGDLESWGITDLTIHSVRPAFVDDDAF